ncbi:hypothetical protein BU204_10995 [Actinophytocola xanthii]|uniref:Major facilitator superfamily (MFS) profile domain-containing protein n=2 Tax=Actinophytocola xanthii TaxID=1912961 RepID=A0A1Q8CTA3_9PSEU|nr:hypothetical protein BU204_10995 [Actinophytocola xanthii]
MVALQLAAFGAMCGFYLLLSVVPLYAAESGGGGLGAGLVTGVMMLATVLLELAVPLLLARLGYRVVTSLGLVLLGLPALALVPQGSGEAVRALVLAVSLVRGAGLGIVVVVGSALAAELLPPQRRAEGLALYGVVVGIPAVVAMPAGIWLSEHVGYAPVFLAAAAAALLPLAVVPVLPARTGDIGRGSVLRAFRIGGLARPTIVFTAVTFAAGVFATFLPLAAPAGSRELAAIALLVQAVAMSLGRLASGRFGDRHGSGPLLVPGVVAATSGAALVIWVDAPVATVAGMALFGVGFGVAQNVTLAIMFDRVERADYGGTSALWNLAYDTGFGLGAIGFGLVVGPFGFVTGFALTAVVLSTALVPAILDRRMEER